VYNGLGDRVQQTVNSVTTTYALVLNTTYTQVLNDGNDTYLYNLRRIGEEDTASSTPLNTLPDMPVTGYPLEFTLAQAGAGMTPTSNQRVIPTQYKSEAFVGIQ
jgi:hypothetical protein